MRAAMLQSYTGTEVRVVDHRFADTTAEAMAEGRHLDEKGSPQVVKAVAKELRARGIVLGQQVGEGGEGDVFHAFDLNSRRPLAVKVWRRVEGLPSSGQR